MASRITPTLSAPTSEATTDRRQDILNAALACATEGGVDAVTIDGVRARCGASVGSIYHHFGNKDGIVAALFTFQVMGMCPDAGQFLFKLQVGPFEFTQFSAEVVNGMAVGTVENEHDDPWASLDGVTVITLA